MSVSTSQPTSSTLCQRDSGGRLARSPVVLILATTGIWSLLSFAHWFLVPHWRGVATDTGVVLPKVAVMVFQLNEWLHSTGLASVIAILLSMGTLIFGLSLGLLSPRAARVIASLWGVAGLGLLAAVAITLMSL